MTQSISGQETENVFEYHLSPCCCSLTYFVTDPGDAACVNIGRADNNVDPALCSQTQSNNRLSSGCGGLIERTFRKTVTKYQIDSDRIMLCVRSEIDSFVLHGVDNGVGAQDFLRDTARYKSGADVKQSMDRVKINILLSNFPRTRIFYCLSLSGYGQI